MNYNKLRYIVTVAETGNFTIAAKKLFISQPSLSQSIKNEEKRIGTPLFDRTQSPIALTDAGTEYVLWAKQILYMNENLEKRLQDYASKELTVIKMGILPEFSAFILPEPLKVFREEVQNCFVQIRELSSSDLKKSIEESELDFIVGLTHPDAYKYFNIPLFDEKIVLAVTPDFMPADKNSKEVNLAEFSEAPFVMMEEGQFLYRVSHDLCMSSGFVPRTVVECYNLETALRLIKAGVGVSVIPDLMARLIDGLQYYDIKGATPQSQISIVFRRDKYLTKSTKRLIRLIKKGTNSQAPC
ncbi:MAG: LysR family transcriptional regulator [Tissierellaceae bacterium]|nr:LysR family transcriptional regulator [Tissierellaceae bacterium]